MKRASQVRTLPVFYDSVGVESELCCVLLKTKSNTLGGLRNRLEIGGRSVPVQRRVPQARPLLPSAWVCEAQPACVSCAFAGAPRLAGQTHVQAHAIWKRNTKWATKDEGRPHNHGQAMLPAKNPPRQGPDPGMALILALALAMALTLTLTALWKAPK